MEAGFVTAASTRGAGLLRGFEDAPVRFASSRTANFEWRRADLRIYTLNWRTIRHLECNSEQVDECAHPARHSGAGNTRNHNPMPALFLFAIEGQANK